MGWGKYSSDIIPFPTPNRNRNVYYPNIHHAHRRNRSSSRRRENEAAWEKSISALRDRKIKEHAGDLGWTLEYATAWLYRHLVRNQTEAADFIDRVREVDVVDAETPFIIFDYLNRVLFGGKLRGMVHLRWKALASNSPGTTSAPKVVPGVDRICIELNKTPFEDGEGDIDELLDALLHQMIHAFFLVTCGAQPKGAKQDGRLLDGLHFGVIMYTIQDIARQCKDEPLELTFYAATRQDNSVGPFAQSYLPNGGRQFIALDPKGSTVAAAPADGQSHCNLDNRHVRVPQIKNWQVETYSVTIDLDMESKGDVIYDLNVKNQLDGIDRLKGPPSSTYIELIWDKKRIMVKREHAHKYPSIKKPLEKNKKMELAIPECSMRVFRHIYDFFNQGHYSPLVTSEDMAIRLNPGRDHRKGPPILIDRGMTMAESHIDIVVHLETFKVAEAMKFEELQVYVLRVLWGMADTDSDPIEVLKVLYHENDNSGPIHSEMHKWARAFLGRIEGGSYPDRYGYNAAYRGTSNLEKIRMLHDDRFKQLYYRNMALKDDYKIVCAGLDRPHSSRDPLADRYGLPGLASPSPSPAITDLTDTVRRTRTSEFPRSRPWSSPYGGLMSPATSTSSLYSTLDSLLTSRDEPRWLCDARSVGLEHRRPPLGLPGINPTTGPTFNFYDRDGRLNLRHPFTGEKLVRKTPRYGRDEFDI